MPIYPDYRYDAYMLILKLDKVKTKKIDWDNEPIFVTYSKKIAEQYKCTKSLANCAQWRYQLRQGASRFDLSPDQKYLMRDGKRVLREGEYEDVLLRFHDEGGHPGVKKFMQKVSSQTEALFLDFVWRVCRKFLILVILN